MKIRLFILLTKLLKIGCKIFRKNGSVFPGSVLFRHDKNALNKVIYPKYVIGVTGSSGKGSTVNVIAKILTSAGYKVTYNASGSNAVRGIYTHIMTNTSVFTKKVKGDVLLLEIDERHMTLAFPKPVFTHLVITNITRDQPSRNYTVDTIYQIIENSTNRTMKLIINIDDPIVTKYMINHPDHNTTYGISKTNYSLNENNSLSLDHSYCYVCSNKLNYDYYHYGHLGGYHCKNGCFKRPKPNYEGTDVDLEKQTMKVNGNEIHIDNNVFFAAYYSLAAYATCKEIGITDQQILNYFNTHQDKSKRMTSYLEYQGKKINIIESKNENNLSYLQSINYLVNDKNLKSYIIGFEHVSRRHPHNDISWLYDIDFELLNNEYTDKIFCVGQFKYDVAVRLKYADIPKDKIIIVEDINNIFNDLNNAKGSIYTLVCFEMIETLTSLAKGGKK